MKRLPTIMIHHGLRLDETELAQIAVSLEGGVKQVDIAQGGEMVRRTLKALALVWEKNPTAVVATLMHHRPKRRKRKQ